MTLNGQNAYAITSNQNLFVKVQRSAYLSFINTDLLVRARATNSYFIGELFVARQPTCTWLLMRQWFRCKLMIASITLSALPVLEILTVAGAFPVAPAFIIGHHLGMTNISFWV